MKHLFVPYKLAVKLKENGFDEPCLAKYVHFVNSKDLNNPKCELLTYKDSIFGENHLGKNSDEDINNSIKQDCTAPLYQQVSDWFIEKHNLHFYIVPYGDCENWTLANIGYTNRKTEDYRLLHHIKDLYDKVKFKSYYEALEVAIEEAFKII